MKTFEENGTGIFIHEKVQIGRNVKIGHCSCIGYGNPEDGDIIIGNNVTIGAFCVIHFGAKIGDGVFLDHYTKIGVDSKIGKNSRILYGKHVYDEAQIGKNCIIGGHVADRTIIEDNVTYMGEIAHSHRNAKLDWDETVELSPIIHKGSVIGVNALIIGGRKIGPCAYIGAGEVVRTDVGEYIALMKGEMKPLSEYRGLLNPDVMNKSYRSINIFVSHPFEPKNTTYDIEKFRTNIKLLISGAENLVRKEYSDFDIETTFVFSDLFVGLPKQIENKIRNSHLGIVDITENKANIFFEYGLLYGLDIPALLIKAADSMETFRIPADIIDRLPIVYPNFEKLQETVVSNLAEAFKKILHNDSLANIYLNKIWFPDDIKTIHVITSTESEKRIQFADPESDNYMLLESLGDKDSLLSVVTFLNRHYRNITIPMYAADNFSMSLEDNIVVIGGPGDEEGDNNPVCNIFTNKMNGRISYSDDCEKLLYKEKEYVAEKIGNKIVKDYGYFARFPNPFNPRTSVVLIHGIHTFGVLGAAKAFSDHPSAQGNIRKVFKKINLDDIKQASFECFFPVDVSQQSVVCPEIAEENIFPLEKSK